MPALFFIHATLAGRHDARDAFRDFPEEFPIAHRRHTFFIRQVSRLAAQPREIRFITRPGFTVTENAIAFLTSEVKLFAFRNRFRRRSNRVLGSQVFFEKSCAGAFSAGGVIDLVSF
jgi:hypothetical protein